MVYIISTNSLHKILRKQTYLVFHDESNCNLFNLHDNRDNRLLYYYIIISKFPASESTPNLAEWLKVNYSASNVQLRLSSLLSRVCFK